MSYRVRRLFKKPLGEFTIKLLVYGDSLCYDGRHRFFLSICSHPQMALLPIFPPSLGHTFTSTHGVCRMVRSAPPLVPYCFCSSLDANPLHAFLLSVLPSFLDQIQDIKKKRKASFSILPFPIVWCLLLMLLFSPFPSTFFMGFSSAYIQRALAWSSHHLRVNGSTRGGARQGRRARQRPS